MAGYSRTPLARKLGLKPGLRVAFFDLPEEVADELRPELADCKTLMGGELDFSIIFVKTQKNLEKEFVRFSKRLNQAGMLWVSWPKKTSGIACEFSENEARRVGLAAGLVDVKVCAVNEVWSGLKFVIRVKDRKESRK